jgi:hypothetical protein
VFGEAHGSRAASDRQGRLERASREVDPVGQQLGDAVRDDRAREVDRLAARADEWDLGNQTAMSISDAGGAAGAAPGSTLTLPAAARLPARTCVAS